MGKLGKEDEEEVTVVTDDADLPVGETVVVDEEAAKRAAEAADKEDERVAQGDEEEGDADDASATEAVRARRREERKAKKERQRVAQERNQRELRFLRDRNAELERRFSAVEQRTLYTEASTLDDRVYQIDQQIKAADELMTTAIEKGEGATFTEAQGIRDQLKDTKNKLLSRKQAVAKEATAAQQRQPGVQGEAQPDPEMVRHAQEWVAKNNWYRADRGDTDSAVTGAIDDRLVQEGWDPASPDYWQELDSRVKQYLPHRAPTKENGASGGNGANGQQRQSNGSERRGPAMANGARERSLRPGEVYVSPERKQAMVEAGVWEDPVLRNRYLKSYANYDKEEANSSRQ